MGLLTKGKPLCWKEAQQHLEYVKTHGITQFINLYAKTKDAKTECFKWGDEIEGMLVVLSRKNGQCCRLLLRAPEILDQLEAASAELSEGDSKNQWNAAFHPEYGSYMVEATPMRPYGGFTAELRDVQRNMRLRRELIEMFLNESKGEYFVTIPIYPLLGAGIYSAPQGEPHGPHADSEWLSDIIIHPHPRFGQLTSSIRERRGENVHISVPLFKDSKTPESLGDTITGDAMGFGMGNCCLQTTFQATCDAEARKLYDQLAVLAPIMMAVSAASPMFHGYLMDQDTRWNIISASVDCRNKVERGEAENDPEAKRQFRRIAKSRYDSISSFIDCDGNGMDDKYNDIELEIDEGAFARLREGGVPERLARHVAHLFIRDPLVIFEGIIEVDDELYSEHFENLQSTNWQSVRYKPPTGDNLKMGFRVEFRTMEVQLTDFENAAFCVFIALVSRAILYFNLNMYVPISVVDANMKTAHNRDAVLKDKFPFRTRIVDGGAFSPAKDRVEDEYAPMTCGEILCGRHWDHVAKGNESKEELARIEQEKKDMPGLIKIVGDYLDAIECDEETRQLLDSYMELVAARATGELMTLAAFMREYVTGHRNYQKDSKVPMSTTCDLMHTLICIQKGLIAAPELLNRGNVVRERESSTVSMAVRTEESSNSAPVSLRTVDDDDGSCCAESKTSPLQTLGPDEDDYGGLASGPPDMPRLPSAEHPVRVYLHDLEVDLEKERSGESVSRYLTSDKKISAPPNNCECAMTVLVKSEHEKTEAQQQDTSLHHVVSDEFIPELHKIVAQE